jgi:hypothetical protein
VCEIFSMMRSIRKNDRVRMILRSFMFEFGSMLSDVIFSDKVESSRYSRSHSQGKLENSPKMYKGLRDPMMEYILQLGSLDDLELIDSLLESSVNQLCKPSLGLLLELLTSAIGRNSNIYRERFSLCQTLQRVQLLVDSTQVHIHRHLVSEMLFTLQDLRGLLASQPENAEMSSEESLLYHRFSQLLAAILPSNDTSPRLLFL